MAAGFPTKANFATGDVLSATNMNDLAGTVNLIAPTAKGDLYAGSAANTYTKLAVGTDGQVLTADSTAATGIKWAAAGGSSGSMTLLSTTTLSGTSTTISGISQSYIDLYIVYDRVTQNTTGGYLRLDCNAYGTSNYNSIKDATATAWTNVGGSQLAYPFGQNTPNSGYELFGYTYINNYTDTTTNCGKVMTSAGCSFSAASIGLPFVVSYFDRTTAISSLKFDYSNGGTISGTVKIYGVK